MTFLLASIAMLAVVRFQGVNFKFCIFSLRIGGGA